MNISINKNDIVNVHQILDRGLYFYKKITPKEINVFFTNKHAICDLCFYIRSLAEITLGMTLWFKSDANIKTISSAALIDQAHLFVKIVKQKQNEGKSLSEFDKQILEHAKDKYNAVWYPNGKVQITKHRRSDQCFLDTFNLTSKFIHQDEYSILGLEEAYNDSTNFYSLINKKLIEITLFWRMDFRNQIVIFNQRYPNIINKYNGYIPFDYQEITEKEYYEMP